MKKHFSDQGKSVAKASLGLKSTAGLCEEERHLQKHSWGGGGGICRRLRGAPGAHSERVITLTTTDLQAGLATQSFALTKVDCFNYLGILMNGRRTRSGKDGRKQDTNESPMASLNESL